MNPRVSVSTSPAAVAGASAEPLNPPAGQSDAGASSAEGTAPWTLVPDAAALAASFGKGLDVLTATLARALIAPDPDFSRYGKVSSRRVAAVPLLIAMLREFPRLSTRKPEDIAALVTWADALERLAERLVGLTVQIQDTVRVLRAEAWRQANGVYLTATNEAPTSPALQRRLDAVIAILSQGRRSDTSHATHAAADHAVTKAQARADRAQLRADLAARAHARVVEARAANKAVRGAVVPPVASPGGTQTPSR